MSRLRSLQSPITRNTPSPSATPPRSRQSTSNPYPQDTSTYHRKLRAILGEVDNCMDAWDEAAKDGFTALKGVVDEGTEMDNLSALEISVSRPPITPHYVEYNKHLDQTVVIFQRLNKILAKLRILQETTRNLLAESLTLRPVEESLVDPLWGCAEGGIGGTWTLERFVISLDPLAAQHALHLFELQRQADLVVHPSSAASSNSKSTSISKSNSKSTTTTTTGNTLFDTQKSALETYRDLLYRSDRQSWRTEWEELVEGEMGGWQQTAGGGGGEGDEVASPGSKGRKGGRGRGGSVEPGDY